MSRDRVAALSSEEVERPPVVLAVLPHFIPSTVIGVVKPLLALHREGRIEFDVAMEEWVSHRRLARADVVVFCRNTDPHYQAPLETALALGKPIIYELDDDFFTVPPGTPGSQYHRDPARLRQLERYLRRASLVRVYSEALRARVATLNPRVERVEPLVDWDLVPAAPPRRAGGPVRIVYATGRVVDHLAAMFMADLRRILERFPRRVEAWFWGYRADELAGRRDVHCLEFIDDYDEFFRRFSRGGFDVGLAPLPDDEFYRAKSDTKFREYAACRIAGIYSDVVVYRERVSPGRTGLLVGPGPGAWFEAMARLIEDEALRTRIQEEAWADVRARYSVERTRDAWLAQLEATLRHHAPLAKPLRGARAMLGVGARTASLLRRGAETLRGMAAPRPLALRARIGRHLRSVRALRRLRRELARPRGREA